MQSNLTEYHKAILSYISENKSGKRRKDAILDEFIIGPLTKQHIKSITRDLERLGYITPVTIGEQRISVLGEDSDKSISHEGYRITQLGKGVVGGSYSAATIYNNVNNSNIAHGSPNATQTIRISEQPHDIREKILDLQDAVARKDSQGIKKAFGYIADKSVDVAIAVVTGVILS